MRESLLRLLEGKRNTNEPPPRPFLCSSTAVDPLPHRRYVPARPSDRESSLFAGQELNIAQTREARVARGHQDFTLLLWAK